MPLNERGCFEIEDLYPADVYRTVSTRSGDETVRVNGKNGTRDLMADCIILNPPDDSVSEATCPACGYQIIFRRQSLQTD